MRVFQHNPPTLNELLFVVQQQSVGGVPEAVSFQTLYLEPERKTDSGLHLTWIRKAHSLAYLSNPTQTRVLRSCGNRQRLGKESGDLVIFSDGDKKVEKLIS